MYPYINVLGIIIPSYGLCMTIAFFLCCFLYINKSRKIGLLFEDMIIVAAVSLGSALLSGGLLYIIVTYSFEELCNFIKNGDFSFITNSGLVFYGGLIGGIFGVLASTKILKVNVADLELCVVPYIPLGHAIGRIGCLLAGCCHGFKYDGFFAVQNTIISTGTYFPIQAVESLINILIMLLILIYVRKPHPKYHTLYLYLILYSIMRFCLEFFRGDELRGVFVNFSTSQWISIFIFLFCVFAKYCFSNIKKGLEH